MGNVFKDLGYISNYIGQDQPIYGLQDGYEHPSGVKTLAEHYLKDIRKHQPKGPYHLVGICSGGVLAYEMSQQLVNQGEKIAFLALVEPAALPLPGRRSYRDLFSEIWERFTRQVGDRSSDVSRLSLAEINVYLRLRWKVIRNLWSQTHYSLKTYPGRFHLFLTDDSLTTSPRLDWSDYAGEGASVHKIPGTHQSITGDNTEISEKAMQDLAEQLREYIDEVIEGD
jgi:thioesterase domain-containing protein